MNKEEFEEKLMGVLQKYINQTMSRQVTKMMEMDILQVFFEASETYNHGIEIHVVGSLEDRRVDIVFLKNGKRIEHMDELFEDLTRYIPEYESLHNWDYGPDR